MPTLALCYKPPSFIFAKEHNSLPIIRDLHFIYFYIFAFQRLQIVNKDFPQLDVHLTVLELSLSSEKARRAIINVDAIEDLKNKCGSFIRAKTGYFYSPLFVILFVGFFITFIIFCNHIIQYDVSSTCQTKIL
jgi:hypothetical protein